MSDSENSGDEIWEEISVHSDQADGVSESSGSTSDEDSDDIEPGDEVEVIRGAEPYRTTAPCSCCDEGEDAIAPQPQPAANDRLNNTNW